MTLDELLAAVGAMTDRPHSVIAGIKRQSGSDYDATEYSVSVHLEDASCDVCGGEDHEHLMAVFAVHSNPCEVLRAAREQLSDPVCRRSACRAVREAQAQLSAARGRLNEITVDAGFK